MAIFGAASEAFCFDDLEMSNVDGTAGDDILVGRFGGFIGSNRGGAGDVYGFVGGTRDRFVPAGSPSPAPGSTTIRLLLEDDLGGTYPDATLPERPDFIVNHGGNNRDFPTEIVAADLTGDGNLDLVVSDALVPTAGCIDAVGCGEVYVVLGGALGGTQLDLNTAPVQLLETITFRLDQGRLGDVLERVPTPRPGDAADWLVVGRAGREAVLFKASQTVGGLEQGPFPLASISDYNILDNTDWTGTTLPGFGNRDVAAIGDFDRRGGDDIVLLTGADAGAWGGVVFSYDAGSDDFVKSIVLQGKNNPSNNRALALGSYLGPAGGGEEQLVISSQGASQIFVFH